MFRFLNRHILKGDIPRRYFSELGPQTSVVAKQYDPGQHTLLKNIFTYRYKEHYLGIFMKFILTKRIHHQR